MSVVFTGTAASSAPSPPAVRPSISSTAQPGGAGLLRGGGGSRSKGIAVLEAGGEAGGGSPLVSWIGYPPRSRHHLSSTWVCVQTHDACP